MHDLSSRRGEFPFGGSGGSFPRDIRASRRSKRRFDDEPTTLKRVRGRRTLPSIEEFDAADGLLEGDRWSTWDQSIPTQRGPKPHPAWLVTDLAAVDTELGILKTGKEADVFLIRRGVPRLPGPACSRPSATATPGTGCSTETAATWRDAGSGSPGSTGRWRAGPRSAGRPSPASGRTPSSARWPGCTRPGCPSPTRSQVLDTELLLEFIGSPDGVAAPRLAETRPEPAELTGLWDQLVQALVALARDGLAHGDLSAYNLLLHEGRLVMIDLPQVVDVIANPRGEYVPDPRRGEHRPLVHRARPGRREPGPRRPARPAPPRGHARCLDGCSLRGFQIPARISNEWAVLRNLSSRTAHSLNTGSVLRGRVGHSGKEMESVGPDGPGAEGPRLRGSAAGGRSGG